MSDVFSAYAAKTDTDIGNLDFLNTVRNERVLENWTVQEAGLTDGDVIYARLLPCNC
jgi:hypothetical protein